MPHHRYPTSDAFRTACESSPEFSDHKPDLILAGLIRTAVEADALCRVLCGQAVRCGASDSESWHRLYDLVQSWERADPNALGAAFEAPRRELCDLHARPGAAEEPSLAVACLLLDTLRQAAYALRAARPRAAQRTRAASHFLGGRLVADPYVVSPPR